VKEQVTHSRKETSKVPDTSIGLPSSHSLENIILSSYSPASTTLGRYKEISEKKWLQVLLGQELCHLSSMKGYFSPNPNQVP